MGIYLNPGSRRFEEALNSNIYVDKTAMVADVNALVNTTHKNLCVSRPRRFGKSIAAAMLCAYYGQGGAGRALFENRLLSKCPDWDRYLGKFNVLRINIVDFLQDGETLNDTLKYMTSEVTTEIMEAFPDCHYGERITMRSVMGKVLDKYNCQFVIIIDEWDAIFREYSNDYQAQKDYLDFLRNWLKDQDYVALAYMTGILPIKKYGKHSALNMFSEYSMLAPLELAPYTGFTEEEVQSLCQKFGRSFKDIKEWYDGYQVFGPIPPDPGGLGLRPVLYHLYSPLSVVNAVTYGTIANYWNKTETYEALAEYIRMDFDGLKETVVRLMEGERIPVNLGTYHDLNVMPRRHPCPPNPPRLPWLRARHGMRLHSEPRNS